MLAERLRAALRTAIKARDRVAVTALRSALAAIENAEIADREAAARTYATAGHTDRADLLLAEAAVLRRYTQA